MFGLSGFELFLIIIFGFLIVGPDKLPAMAKTIGQGIAKFRTAQQEMSDVLKTGIYDPDSEDPFKNPLDLVDEADRRVRKATSKTGANSTAKPAAKAPAKRVAAKPAAKPIAKPAGEGAASAVKTVAQGESFQERKARYAAERAERLAAGAGAVAAAATVAAQPSAAKPADKPASDEPADNAPVAEKPSALKRAAAAKSAVQVATEEKGE